MIPSHWPICAAMAAVMPSVGLADPVDCTRFRVGGAITSEMPVSTFHHRGVIAEPRYMPVTWPDLSRRLGGPTMKDGRAIEADSGMLFEVDLHTGEALYLHREDGEQLSINITAVDYLPIASALNRLTWRSSSEVELRNRPDGTSYWSWDGYIETGEVLYQEWIEVTYPSSPDWARAQAGVYIKADQSGTVARILNCGRHAEYVNPFCDLYFKAEPLEVSVRFPRALLDQIDEIDMMSAEFAECMLTNPAGS